MHELWRKGKFSFFALLFLSVSPFFIEGSVWARYYSLVLLVFLLYTYWEEKLLSSPLWLALFLAFAGYLDYLLFGSLLLRLLWRLMREGKRGFRIRTLKGVVGGLLLFSPWCAVLLSQLARRGGAGPFLSILKKFFFSLYVFGVGENGVPFEPSIFLGLLSFAFFAVLGGILERERAIYLLSAVSLWSYALTRFAYVGDEFFPFRLFFLLPLALELVGRGVVESLSRWRWTYLLLVFYLVGLATSYWHLMRREEFLNAAYYFPGAAFQKILKDEGSEVVLSVTPAAKFYCGEGVKFFLVSDPRGEEEALRYLRSESPTRVLFVGAGKLEPRLEEFLSIVKISYYVAARVPLLEESPRTTTFKRFLGVRTTEDKFYVLLLEFKPLEGDEVQYGSGV
jgi:hypothetical protein